MFVLLIRNVIFVRQYMANMKIMIITISLIHKNQNFNDKKFWQIGIWVIFWNLSYGPPWRIPHTFPIIWSSLDISNNKSWNNYLISKSKFHPMEFNWIKIPSNVFSIYIYIYQWFKINGIKGLFSKKTLMI